MGTITAKTAGQTLRKAAHYVFSGQFTRLFTALGERLPSWLLRCNAARLLKRNISSNEAVLDAVETQCVDYLIREALREDLRACAELVGLPEVEFARRFDCGDRCIAVFHGERPVHVTWLHFGPCYVRGLNLLLQLDIADCYVYGAFTDPEHRRKGLYGRLHQELLRLLSSLGTTLMVILVMEKNPSAFLLFTRLGYQFTHVIRHVAVCGIRSTAITATSHGANEHQLRWGRPAGVFWI